MINYTSTPIKVSGFFLLISILFSCTKDSDILIDYVLEDSFVPIENFENNSQAQEETEVTIDLVNGTFETQEDNIAIFGISDLSNNTDGKSPVLKDIIQPLNGQIVVEKDSILKYLPNSDFNGIDSFVFTIENTDENNSVTESELSLEVIVNPVPDAVNDTLKVNLITEMGINVLNNDTFANKNNVTVTQTSAPTNGTVTVNEDKSLIYVPVTASDTDTFTYTTEVQNEDGSITTEEANVFIVVDSAETPTNTSAEDGYIVTPTGSTSNDGLTEGTSWSLEHAFKTARAGDIVYVKAGNYASANITTSVGGNVGNPIKFIGYKITPGDIMANNGTTYTKDDWLANGQTLPDDVMPHMEANPVNFTPESGDQGIVINHPHIEIHNFMLSEYFTGIKVAADNVLLDNIIGFQFGMWNPASNCWNSGDNFQCDNRTGYGIYSRKANNLTVRNSLIIDAGLAAVFPVHSNNVLIEWTKAYSYNSGNGSDYLFDLFGTSNSIIRDCYAERTYTTTNGHKSRALVLQAISDNNLVERFSCKNSRIQIENSRNNTLKGIYSEGSGSVNDGGLQIFGQSNDNLFVNWELVNASGIMFLGIVSAEAQRTPHTSAGDNNYFINFIIRDLPAVSGNAIVSFHRLDAQGSNITGGTNYIIGLTADNYPWIINANRPGTINFYNSTFSNGSKSSIDTFYTGWTNAIGSYSASFTNCNDYNNAFPPILGTNITTYNPTFMNPSAKDFTLKSNSPLRDRGMDGNTLKAEAAYDILGNPRGTNGGYDIGAYEY